MKMNELSRFSIFTDVRFGLHSSRDVGSQCKKLGATKVIVVTDNTVIL